MPPCQCGRGRMKRAFTIIELLVAIGILAIVLSFAGTIFRVSIDAQRTAMANSEIMQNFRAITGQLSEDFQGLRKDAEIFVVWVADDSNPEGVYQRFDKIMFFADGDFQSYQVSPVIRGNVARISYMLAKTNGISPQAQPRAKRMLARTQHIITANASLPNTFDPNSFSSGDWFDWNNRTEYEKLSIGQWLDMSMEDKEDALSVVTDVNVMNSDLDSSFRGASINPTDANSIHLLLCQGIGEFKVQGWNDLRQRWIPELDPDADGDLADSDFFLSEDDKAPGALYPYPHSFVSINGLTYRGDQITEQYFNEIPGFGRALKFTFTLYDSKGIIKQGKTFTHIVYLDK